MTVIFVLGLMAGCGGGDSNINSSPLVGVWITEMCEQAINDNIEITAWVKGLFEFTTQGTVTVGNVSYSDQGIIKLGHIAYSDSNCVISTSTQTPSDVRIGQPILYQDLGEEVLQEGILGSRLTIGLTTPESIQSVTGFYTLNNGSLCFSDNVTFEPFSSGVSPTGSSAIDYENCLTKVDSP